MFNDLVKCLNEYESVVLGFSGGVDSSLVAFALKSASVPYVCVTVQTPLQKRSEIAQSAFFCTEYGINHKIIQIDVLEDDDINCNSKDRCYFCKSRIFGELFKMAKGLGYKNVIDGSNVDDLGEYRPGRRALMELGVKSPLIDCGFKKDDIRKVSKDVGLSTYDMISSPCLATRIPYGDPLNTMSLEKAEKAEAVLLSIGIEDLRVRVHKNLARIEVKDLDKAYSLIGQKEIDRIKELGFEFVTLDLSGYKKGSFDKGEVK